MSLFKELSESHDMLKGIAISTASSPLWFLSIFFLNKPFYDSTDIIIKILLSVTLSVISSMLFYHHIFNAINQQSKKEPVVYMVAIATFFVFLWKAFMLFVAYSVGFLFNEWLYFYWYIVIFFTPLIIIVSVNLVSGKK